MCLSQVLGSPMFATVTMVSGDPETPLVISAKNQGPANVYVQGLTWNGKAVAGVEVQYSDLMKGGVLEFTMGPKPVAL